MPACLHFMNVGHDISNGVSNARVVTEILHNVEGLPSSYVTFHLTYNKETKDSGTVKFSL